MTPDRRRAENRSTPHAPRGFRLCPIHHRIMPVGVNRCWLCEQHDADMERLDRLIQSGRSEKPQYRIVDGEIQRVSE